MVKFTDSCHNHLSINFTAKSLILFEKHFKKMSRAVRGLALQKHISHTGVLIGKIKKILTPKQLIEIL